MSAPWRAAGALALLLSRASPGYTPGTPAGQAEPRPLASAAPGALATQTQPPSSLDLYGLSDHDPPHFDLPGVLSEISGLAMTPDDRLFAHGDERGVLYQLDYRTGGVVKWFALGRRPVRDDFEGMAIVGPRFFLVTSAGTLYETREGPSHATMPYDRYATGLGRSCEVEGLAYDPDTRALLLPCKTPRVRELAGRLSIYAFTLATMRLEDRPRFAVPLAALGHLARREGFHPSSIERNPRTGTFFVLSAREPGLVEISASGAVLGGRRLPPDAHPQAEGVTVARDGTLVISDEGHGRRARLTVYPAVVPSSSNANAERRP